MEATVPMGQTVTLAAGETLTLVADNGNDGIVSFGFSQMEFIGSGSASQTVEWEAGPDRTQGESGGRWDSFNVTFGPLIASGDVPSPIPEQVALMSAKVEWWAGNYISDEDRTNTANVRHLVVTDADGLVVAVSDEVGEPLPTVAADATSTFYFPEGTQLSSTESYECFFVGADSVPQLGASLTSGLTVRYAVLGSGNGGVAAAATFYVNGQQNKWSPAIDFTLQGQVAASGEEIVNGDSISVDFRHGDSHLVDDETDYGVVPVAGAHWNDFMSSTSSAVNWRDLEVTDSAGRTGIKLAVSAAHMQDWYASSSDEEKAGMIPILRSGLADTSTVSLSVTGIPYAVYDLYLYFACDDYFDWDTNCSVTLNGESNPFYYMPEGADVAATSATNESWGNSHLVTDCEIGQNVMRIAKLSGESLDVTINRDDVAHTRGCLTAIQIVELRSASVSTRWEGTIEADSQTSTLMVSNGTTTKALSRLTDADTVELSFERQATLTVDSAVTVASLTLAGADGATLVTQANNASSITAAEISIEGGAVMTANGTFVSEAPIDLAQGATLQIQGTNDDADFTQAVTGAGAVVIATGNDVTLGADFTHTGGTTVFGTLRYGGHALGAVTVNAGGVFDLCGLACDQDIALNGGTLANSGAEPSDLPQFVASVNFNSDSGKVADDATGGLQQMLGTLWTNTTETSGNSALNFVEASDIGNAAAQVTPMDGASVAWTAGAWQYDVNTTPYLVGYLDDVLSDNDFERSITVNMPANVAAEGYDVYLYFNSDNPKDHGTNYDDHFSAVAVRAGESGATTYYTYVDGELTTTNGISVATGWGSISGGFNAVAEGTNVMVLRHRSETTLQMSLHAGGTDTNNPHLGPRGSIAAIQIVTKTGVLPPVYSGTLTVEGTGTLNAAAGTTFSGTLAGAGTLTKVGDGALSVTGATATAGTTLAATAGGLTFGEGNDLSGLTLNLGVAASVEEVSAFTLGALSGNGAFNLGDVDSLTFAGAAAEADYTGALSAGGALSLVKQGTNTQTLGDLAGIDALAVEAEGGILALEGVTALTDLETRGGNVTGLPTTVAYAEMAAGNAAAATTATAGAARPAAETATAATVSNFTLADNGEIRYLTAADFDKWFPEGFLVSGRTYRLVLGPDLADAAPVRFTVLGAPKDITLVPYREGPDGPVEIASGVTITDGTTVYIDSAAAIIGDLSTLPAKYHHYPFTGNVNDAVSDGNNLNEDADVATYTAENIDNGQALSGGTPYGGTGLVFNPDGDSWTLGLYLNVAETDPSSLLLHVGTANGSNAGGALILATGEEPGTLRLWRKHETENVYNALATVDLGLGGATAWHHLLVTHSATVYQVYVDGELAARVEGDFPEVATQIQVGKALSNLVLDGIANGAGRFLLDDLAVWPSVLREGQIDLALAEVTGKWRWNEAATPAELFDAAAQWTDATGAAAAWPTDGTYTARATLTRTADVADLAAALGGFTARWVLLQGEPLTLTITDTAVDLPDTAGTVVVDSALTLDLSGMVYGLLTQAFAENGVRLADGVWNGEITLAGAPEGYDLSVEAREDGLYLSLGSGDYPWSLSFDTFWDNLSASTLYGMDGYQVAGANWNTVRDTSYTVTNPRRQDGTTQAGVSLSVVNAGGQWYHSGYRDLMMKGTTDGPSRYAFTGLPAGQYEVVVYFHTRGANNVPISPVKVIGGGSALWYTYATDASEPTASDTVPTTGWGDMSYDVVTHGYSEALGKTILRAPATVGMDGTLTIEVSDTEDPTAGPGLDWQLPSGVTARGFIAGVQVVAIAPMPLYTRTVNGTEAWTATGAWTKMDDGSTVDAPTGADVHALVGIDGDTALDMGDLTAVTLGAIETYGDGILTLTFKGDAVADAIAAAALPEGETYALVSAALDPEKVRVRVTPPDSGAAIVVTVTATGATATAIAPVGNVYRATVSGSTDWQAIEWTPEGAPTADDTAILTLEGDADLIGAGQVAMLQVYADSHAVSRANTVTAGAWHFLEDATLALKQGQPLPDFATVPKRVRYDYAYAQDYTITDAYETEFAAGFTGNLNTDGNGLIEFSHGDVSIGTYGDTQNASFSTVIFSGDARLTMTGEANANGLKIGNSTVTFRDRATASLSRIHMRSKGTCVSTLIVEDDAAVTLTGAVNGVSNYNTLQLADWTGTGYLIFRDNARFTAAGADMMLCSDGDSSRVNTVTIEDNAEVRVKGIARRSTSAGVIDLRGGRLLIGDRGFQAYSNTASTITLNFNGGAFGAWEDVSLGTDAANVCQTVTGDPVLLSTDGATLTLADGSNFFATALTATVREGTVRGEGATLPNLRLEGGAFVVGAAAQVPTIDLRGGGLTFDGGVLTLLDDLRSEPGSVITLPFLESGTGGHPVMDGGRPLPDLSNVRFVLALDPNRDTEAGLPYQAPLFVGGVDLDAVPRIAGFELRNNTNAAVSHVEPIHAAGSLGLGLYAQLEGQAILTPHTQYLPYTFIDQAAANGHAYWIFQAQADGAALTLPEGGIALRHAVFDGGLAGHSAAVKAAGSEPGLLLQAQSVTVNTDLDFDLTAWADALDGFVRGAVRGVPSSLCLVSAGVSVNDARLTASGVPEVPGVTTEVVATTDGIYLVATADRRTRTVSVNFTTRGLPLSGTPAAPGAYALPIAAWNDLQGATSSADLRVSDVGGVASAHALRGAGDATLPTQVNAYAADFVTDAGAPTPMLQAWLTDAAATSLRLVNLPFARYRLALVFSNDLEDAAYATITIGGDVYAMDAEGYTRKNVSGYGERIPGDTVWGSTDRPAAAAPFVLGHNVLVTDVRDDASLTLSFPAAVYGRTYAGLAAIQVLEVPETEVAEEGVDYAYAFTAAETDVALMDLGLTVEGADAPQTWANGPANTLTLDVPAGVDVTLTLPLNFQADRISATGAGSLTLLVEEDGGAALNTLDATGLGSLTVHFPCVGVAFEPADGVSRFEAAFNNNGATYTIAEGATLALGENSGIAVSLNGTTDRTGASATLVVNLTSPGTLRRDYPMSIPSLPNGTNGAETDMTMAFKAGTASDNPVNLRANLLVEDGDVLRVPNRYHFSGASLVYTQTGGFLLLAAASPDNATAEVSLGGRNGARLETPMVWSWRGNAHVDLDVSGDATLAVGNMGLRANNATARLDATFSEDGTLELTDTTLGTGGSGTVTTTFNGGRIIDPGKYGTLVLNAANTAEPTAVLAVPRGTVALANANGLGNATVTVADGAAFEARGFTGENEASGGGRTVPVVAIKLDIPAGVGNSDGTAIQEFCLYQGDEKVDWPDGTTISGTGGQNTASNEPNWAAGGNEAINALIDGVTGDAASPGTWTNPAGGSTGTYTGNARVNKWYPINNTTGTASATITLGSGVVFDSYTLWCSDLQNRFPTAWTLSVRYEDDAEDSWTVLHAPTGQTRPAANDESEKYAVALREGGATTLDAVTGKVVFASGAQCRAVRKVGVTGLPYVARIAGSIEVGADVRFFLDGTEYTVTADDIDEGCAGRHRRRDVGRRQRHRHVAGWRGRPVGGRRALLQRRGRLLPGRRPARHRLRRGRPAPRRPHPRLHRRRLHLRRERARRR